MYRNILKAKLHRVKVTEANLEYMGSITIDEDIIEKADILANEKVYIVNINNGARFQTYVIPGKRGSGTICLNGAAARLVQPNDEIIIMSYALLDEEEFSRWEPKVLFFDDENKI